MRGIGEKVSGPASESARPRASVIRAPHAMMAGDDNDSTTN
jgi:hypothetical protein